MKKKFKLQDLDCANCAAKMEEAIKNLKYLCQVIEFILLRHLIVNSFNHILMDLVKVTALHIVYRHGLDPLFLIHICSYELLFICLYLHYMLKSKNVNPKF